MTTTATSTTVADDGKKLDDAHKRKETTTTEAGATDGREKGTQQQEDEPVPTPQPPPTLHTASLYVGDLASTVTEEKLKEKFSTIGRVLSVRICRDNLSHASLRYGYVNYHSHEHAKRALVDLNFENVDGQPMRIMWVERNPENRRNSKGNLFIKNLGDHVDSKAIYDTFTMFGAILSCKVVLDEKGKSRGFGFIHFEDEAAAQQAKEKVHGMELDGKIICVVDFIPREKRHNMSVATYTNVYVNNFDDDVSSEQLKEKFSLYGPIKSVAVGKSDNGPKGKAYGFVDFEVHDHAVKSVEELNGTLWDGSLIYVARYMRKAEYQAHKRNLAKQFAMNKEARNLSNLYVRFYDAVDSDAELKKIFEPYGTITSAKVMRDPSGRSLQFGFVAYEREVDAKRAREEMDQKQINGYHITVNMAMTKEKRRQLMEAQAHYAQVQQQQQQQMLDPSFYMRGPAFQRGAQPVQPMRQFAQQPQYQPRNNMSASFPPMRHPQQQMMGMPAPFFAQQGMQLYTYPMPAPFGQVAGQFGGRATPAYPRGGIVRQQTHAPFQTAPLRHADPVVVLETVKLDERMADVRIDANEKKEELSVPEQDGYLVTSLVGPVEKVLKKLSGDVGGRLDAYVVSKQLVAKHRHAKLMGAMGDEKELTDLIRSLSDNKKH